MESKKNHQNKTYSQSHHQYQEDTSGEIAENIEKGNEFRGQSAFKREQMAEL